MQHYHQFIMKDSKTLNILFKCIWEYNVKRLEIIWPNMSSEMHGVKVLLWLL